MKITLRMIAFFCFLTAYPNYASAQTMPSGIPLPPTVKPDSNRYDVARDTRVTPERLKASGLPEPKVGASGEWIDVNENETVKVQVHGRLDGVIERDSLRSITSYLTDATLIYGTNARNPRVKPRYKMEVPEPPQPQSGSFLVRTQIKDGGASATSYPITTFEEDLIQNPQSLDNNRVVFEIGDSFSTRARFHLYLLNWRTGQLRRLTTQRLSYENWKVSPNKRYIALVRGVDLLGQPLSANGKAAALKVLDVYSGRERLVATNNSIPAGDFCWTKENTLLYSVVGTSKPPLKLLPGEPKRSSVIWARPALYEVPPLSGTPKLVAEDAWRPSVSPDGKRLLFYGSEKPMSKRWFPANWNVNPSYSPLCTADRNGQHRQPVTVYAYYAQVKWLADSKRFLAFSTVNNPSYFGRLEEWDLQTRKRREIWSGKGRAANDEDLAQENPGPAFNILQLSDDQQQLYVGTEITTDKSTYFRDAYDRDVMLWKIDLATGETHKVAQFLNPFGVQISAPQ